jgi:hypothetical protein
MKDYSFIYENWFGLNESFKSILGNHKFIDGNLYKIKYSPVLEQESIYSIFLPDYQKKEIGGYWSMSGSFDFNLYINPDLNKVYSTFFLSDEYYIAIIEILVNGPEFIEI